MSPKRKKPSLCYQHKRAFGKVIKGLLTANVRLLGRLESTTPVCVGQAKTLQSTCNRPGLLLRGIDVKGNDDESTQSERRPCERLCSHPPRAVGICVLALEVIPRAGQPVLRLC